MEIRQTSEQVSDRKWKWSIWIDGPDLELDSVEKVIYHLHPTFADPVVERTNRAEKFCLEASGWGTFVVIVKIHKKDGSIDERRHRLRFSRSEPSVFMAASNQEETEKVKTVLDNLDIKATSAFDLSAGEDWSSGIRERIDRAKAIVLINGNYPSRWVLQEIDTANALGKPIVCIGESTFYDPKKVIRIQDLNELENVLAKLPE